MNGTMRLVALGLLSVGIHCTGSRTVSSVAIVEDLEAFESLIPVMPDSIVRLYERFEPSSFHKVHAKDISLAAIFIDSMNARIKPSYRIDTLVIDHAIQGFGNACRIGRTLQVSSSYFFLFNDPSVIRSVLSHEFGHVYFELLSPALRDTMTVLWNEFERHALFYLFRDGEYSGNAKFGGHPYESPEELFASAFNLFLNRQEEVNARLRYVQRELYPLVGRLRKVVRTTGVL